MMFEFHTAFSAALISLLAGTVFLIWLKKQDAGNVLAKLVGYVVVILSISSLLCASYYGIRYWEDGYFKAPMIIEMRRGPGSGMGMMGDMDMMKEMMKNPMMQKMMKEMMMQKMQEKTMTGNESSSTQEDHEEHHPEEK